MRASDFDFALPPGLIAQTPAPERDQSRLLVLHRAPAKDCQPDVSRRSLDLEHLRFSDIVRFTHPGDVLVLNDSRVLRARLRARHARTGRPFEILLLTENEPNDWWAMMKPGKRAPVGTDLAITGVRQGSGVAVDAPAATVVEVNPEGHRRLRFSCAANIRSLLEEIGEVPLPPYISPASANAELESGGPGSAVPFHAERYQTVYALNDGSVAAPTAGLHFTQRVLEAVRARGVEVHPVTLHVGLGTFAPVKAENLEEHLMHEESFELPHATAAAIAAAKRAGRRVIAVGTTTVRVLETVARANGGAVVPGPGRTRLFIYPPADFQVVDALLTNFHLPRSTLLMLVSAFAAPGSTAGRDRILRAYGEAIAQKYRFFSYGDAMFIT